MNNAHKFLTGLFWYENELPSLYVIKQCADRFGSVSEGLYVVADALENGVLSADVNSEVTLNLQHGVKT